MSLHKNQLLPHFRRSMTCASCSSPAIRAQEPSNHWSQQLPEVPPTNSDDTITIAPRPPTDLTTETEPRIESPNTSQLLNTATAHAMPPINLTTSSDHSEPPRTKRPKLRHNSFCVQTELCWPIHTITCVNMTPLLCQEGLKHDLTQPNPMNSSIQTLVGPERPIHLVLKGLYLLCTLRVSAGTHAADRTSDAPLHRTDELLIDGDIIRHEHNGFLVRRYPQSATRCTASVSPACATQGGEGVLSHVRKTRACGLPDGARSGELHTDQFAPMTATHKVRFTFTNVGLPSTGPGSGKANFIVSLLSSNYAFFTRYFFANMVRV